MKTPEAVLSERLSRVMTGLWIRTRHEDKEISPGVPDISYVMLTGGETGWLELKAEHPAPTFKLRVEPSQHQWIRNHWERVPVHFFVAIGDNWYIVAGRLHAQLAVRMTERDLKSMAIFSTKYPLTPVDTLALSDMFKLFTTRINHGIQGIRGHEPSSTY